MSWKSVDMNLRVRNVRKLTETGQAKIVKHNVTTISIFIGIVLLAASSWQSSQNYMLLEESYKAQGTVLRIEQRAKVSWGKMRGIFFHAVVRFRTASGETIEFASVGYSAPTYGRGEKVTVFYDPKIPNRARIISSGGLWALPVFLAVVGFVALGTGAVRWFTRRRQFWQL